MIFVTGASGLLGSHLIYKLSQGKEPIRALIRSKEALQKIEAVFSFYTDDASEIISGIDWVYGDILDYETILGYMDNCHQVYHCAAKVSFDPKEKHEILKTNIRGTQNIVNACLENSVQKLLYVSSVAAIGSGGHSHSDLNEQYFPRTKNSTYSYSKTKAEFEVWRGIEEGLNAVIVNPSVILGPGFWNFGSSGFFLQIDKGLKYYTRGGTGFVGVWDVVNAMSLLMEKDVSGERYILNAENLLYKDFLGTIAMHLGKKAPDKLLSPAMLQLFCFVLNIYTLFSSTKPGLTSESAASALRISRFSSEKIQKQFDFKFESIDEVVRRVCGYFKESKGSENS